MHTSSPNLPPLKEELIYWARAKVGVSPICQRALERIEALESHGCDGQKDSPLRTVNDMNAEGVLMLLGGGSYKTLAEMPSGFRNNWDRYQAEGRFERCRSIGEYLTAYLKALLEFVGNANLSNISANTEPRNKGRYSGTPE